MTFLLEAKNILSIGMTLLNAPKTEPTAGKLNLAPWLNTSQPVIPVKAMPFTETEVKICNSFEKSLTRAHQEVKFIIFFKYQANNLT